MSQGSVERGKDWMPVKGESQKCSGMAAGIIAHVEFGQSVPFSQVVRNRMVQSCYLGIDLFILGQ